ncbi:MAG: hypothetical protein M1381_00335 [Deltaproteobacteria bacterium]|nr:hypothetical protein [Deltaproteobacteria bacterium]
MGSPLHYTIHMDSKYDLNIRNKNAVIKLLEHEAEVTNCMVVADLCVCPDKKMNVDKQFELM